MKLNDKYYLLFNLWTLPTKALKALMYFFYSALSRKELTMKRKLL